VVSVRIVERLSSRCLSQVRELVPARGALKLAKEAVNRAEREFDGTRSRARPVGHPNQEVEVVEAELNGPHGQKVFGALDVTVQAHAAVPRRSAGAGGHVDDIVEVTAQTFSSGVPSGHCPGQANI
jgi:hypothetical protein